MKYQILLDQLAIEHIYDLKRSGNKAILKKISSLLDELTEHPFTGTGKPEALKYQLSGLWSRRISHEHRIIYRVEENNVFVLSVKGHYT